VKGTRSAERRGFLRALGLGTAAAAATAGSVVAQRADTVPAREAAKETEPQRLAARYRETEHVKAFYRTNGYEQ
jgi:predicted neuraminidase